jgi:hypothetical protein
VSSTSSRFVYARWTAEAAGVPVFRAFGDPDDGLRLTVLRADRLEAEVPNARDEARACKTPRMPWEQRFDALQRLLERAPRPSSRPYLGAIVDPDALYPGRPSARRLWKDRGFNAQRGALFDVLRGMMDLGGWLVIRPNPRPEVSDLLRSHPASVEANDDPIAPSDRKLWAVTRDLGADVRPVVAWLVRAKKALDVNDVRDVLAAQGTEGVETYALMLAYELLKPSAQRAGQRLSALRGPQPVNGMIGGFCIGLDSTHAEGVLAADASERLGGLSIDPQAIDVLEACGFLQPLDPARGRSSLEMPSPIRTFLRRLARLEDPDQWSHDNRVLGSQPMSELLVDEQLEVHHHAVEGGNLEDAKRTALYYGADLRSLAFRMSREERYAEAARVYQIILDEFDPEDAYALEYLGYNMALDAHRRVARGGETLTPEEQRRILNVYARAADKAKTNPLYDGRLLGFRAQLGEPVRTRFDELMRSYRETSRWKKTAMGYFAKAVFDGLARGSRIGERDELFRRWRRDLEGNEHFERHHGE